MEGVFVLNTSCDIHGAEAEAALDGPHDIVEDAK